jgi:hypothetical protein
MAIAYGLVGVADDIVQWRRIRRWGLPAELKIRPTNILMAALSTATSRILSLVPGLMFGTPEALQIDEKQFDERQRNTLLKISAITFTIIGLVVWLPTVVTDLIQRVDILPSSLSTILGGFEAFLLVIFAVALENLFIQMLGFPGSFGHSLKRRSRWLWIGLLILVTFFFYHTLINPRGDLSAALAEGNVLLFLGVAAAFVLLTFGIRFFFHLRNRNTSPAPSPIPVASSTPTPPLTITRSSPTTEADRMPVVAPLGGEKQCPICQNTIKVEAKLCRFCHATFNVTISGYCMVDHAIVEVDGVHRCLRCGADPVDLHVESRLSQAPLVKPALTASQATPKTADEPTAEPAVTDTRKCPSCGKIIKTEAKICRFCRKIIA